ncbi:uncharacterized [Tachysurus ichikawai]
MKVLPRQPKRRRGLTCSVTPCQIHHFDAFLVLPFAIHTQFHNRLLLKLIKDTTRVPSEQPGSAPPAAASNQVALPW